MIEFKPDGASWEDVWHYAAEAFREGQAAHLDDTLVDLGNRYLEADSAMPETRWLAEFWQHADRDQRRRLAHLFMRAVGHEEFL